MASGDDLAELISTLRCTMQSHITRETKLAHLKRRCAYREEMLLTNNNCTSKTNNCDNGNHSDDSIISAAVTNNIVCNDLRCKESHPRSYNQVTESVPTNTITNKNNSTTNNNIIASSRTEESLISDSALCESFALTQFYRKATKAALLFAVESGAAMEQASHLYYEPSTWECTRWGDKHVLTLGRNELCTMLSDHVASLAAREIMNETHNWSQALRVLSNVEETPITRNTGIDICCSAMLWQSAIKFLYGKDLKSICDNLHQSNNDVWKLMKTIQEQQQNYEEKLYWRHEQCSLKNTTLSCLPINKISNISSNQETANLCNANNKRIEEEKNNHYLYSFYEQEEEQQQQQTKQECETWEEIHVTKVIRACFHAALHSCKAEVSHNSFNELQAQCDEIHKEILTVPRPDKETEQARLFYTFPIALITEAVRKHHVEFSTVSAFNDAIGLLSLSTHYVEDGCKLLRQLIGCENINTEKSNDNLQCQESRESNETLHKYNDEYMQNINLVKCEEEEEEEEEEEKQRSRINSKVCSTFPLVKANAITVFHTCKLLYMDCKKASLYANALIRRYNIAIEEDDGACSSYLWMCLQANEVNNAVSIVEKRLWYWIRQATKSTSKEEMRPPFSSTLLIALVRVFTKNDTISGVKKVIERILDGNEFDCDDNDNYDYNHDNTVYEQNKAIEWCKLSKMYNENTLSRAYNTLLQETNNIEIAEKYVLKLRREASTKQRIIIENESLTHLCELYAENGNWEAALNIFSELTETSSRNKMFLPSAKLHDKLQLVLEQAESPRIPSYILSVKLFNEMCERNVPMSEIAFQSAVKQCFKQGAIDEAQELLEKMVRHGVNY